MRATAPLLVMRFSALGDVAMTVPVLRALLQQHPDCSVCVVSNQAYAPLFEGIDRLTFFGAELQGKHRGFLGLLRLYAQLRKAGPYRAVADLHHVLRSQVLSVLFSLAGLHVVRLQKGRKEKNDLTRRHHKQLAPLPTAFERMVQVFASLQLNVVLSQAVQLSTVPGTRSAQRVYKIGIAPFAKHAPKIYPILQMKALVELLHQRPEFSIRLFGAPGKEATILSGWQAEFSGVESMAGRFSLKEELAQLRQLDAIITMDSANMHLASLYDVPAISIWGATHPYAGFMGWGQLPGNAVQVELSCRPCSVFGNKPCFRGDHACMQRITPEAIVERLYTVLERSHPGEPA